MSALYRQRKNDRIKERKTMYQAAEDRYEKMDYKRCGRSGVKLPRVSLGLWQNFGLDKEYIPR